MNNKITASIALGLFLTSCGSHYKRPESFSEKMARYESKTKAHNIVPKLEVADYSYKSTKSRGPASVREESKASKKYSNKRLYFLSLYKQYTELVKYNSKNSPELSICPSFHTSLIDFKEQTYGNKIKKRIDYTKINMNNSQKHPELFLPVTANSQTPRVIDIAKKNVEIADIVDKAIGLHVAKTYAELDELCQTGSSDNYYIYENLITSNIQNKILTPRKESLETLLKTTLFSNMAIISSLKKKEIKIKSRGIASATSSHDITSELFNRININWSKEYFSK